MRLPRINRRRFLVSLFLGTPALALADGLWWEPGWIKVRRQRVGRAASGRRFVQFTDLHHKGDRRYLERVVRIINGLAPDFVCFTGDLIEDARHLPEALEILSQLHPPLYGVPGNHDYWSGADFALIERAFAATGGAWLLDRSLEIPSVGVTLHGATCQRPFAFTRNPRTRNIVLMHYPASADDLSQRFDLVLAGHSHGGQVRIPFYGPVIVPFGVGRYDLGWFDTPGGPLYVSSGIGWFYANIRFNCRPEIVLFEV